jgi:hypothetical protein
LAEVSRGRVLGHSRSLSVEDLLSSIRRCLRVSINEVATTLSMARWVTVVGIETLVRDGTCGCWICCLVLWRRRWQSCILGRRTPCVEGGHDGVKRDQVESRQNKA